MSSAALVQAMVVSAMVAWAVGFALRKLFPVTTRRWLASLSRRFDRPAVPRWLRATARFIEPRASTGASCSDGCSSCGGCGTSEARPAVEPIPLGFRPREKH
ncbi:MAG TPA: DUF6587 family protein [Dokdonella sp.]